MKTIGILFLLVASRVLFAQVPSGGLVAHYPFTGNANDESGNGHDGTVNGATLTVDRFGNSDAAYQFVTDNYISVPHSSEFNITADITISAWYKANSDAMGMSYYTVVTKRDDAFGVPTSFWGIGLEMGSQKGVFSLFNNFSSLDYHFSDNTFSVDAWQHIVAVVKDGVTYIYLDGELDSSSPIAVPLPSNTKPLLIGWDRDTPPTSESFLGSIDDIRIYSRALSEAEIGALYHEEGWDEGLLAYYPFSGSANDASGNGNHGTVYGATLTMDRFGSTDAAYHFETDNYISVPDNSAFNITGDISVSAWYRASSEALGMSYYTVVTKRDDEFGVPTSFWGIGLEMGTQKAMFSLFNNFSSLDYHFTEKTITTDAWQHIVAVVKDNVTYLYLDGELDSSSPITVPLPSNTKPLLIGWDRDTPPTSESFLGSIDDIRIYNRALTEAEVKALYQKGGWNVVVPIELVSLTATVCDGYSIRIEWMTLSETNNFGFFVQRKGAGESEFTDLPSSFVAGHGTTIVLQKYSYIDYPSGSGDWWYRLKQVDLDGTIHYSEPTQVRNLTNVADKIPSVYGLAQNYPNPFNPSTTIHYQLPKSSNVKLSVYDMLGRTVAILVNEKKEAGTHQVEFNAGGLSSGVHFYRLHAGDFVATKRFHLVK